MTNQKCVWLATLTNRSENGQWPPVILYSVQVQKNESSSLKYCVFINTDIVAYFSSKHGLSNDSYSHSWRSYTTSYLRTNRCACDLASCQLTTPTRGLPSSSKSWDSSSMTTSSNKRPKTLSKGQPREKPDGRHCPRGVH